MEELYKNARKLIGTKLLKVHTVMRLTKDSDPASFKVAANRFNKLLAVSSYLTIKGQ